MVVEKTINYALIMWTKTGNHANDSLCRGRFLALK